MLTTAAIRPATYDDLEALLGETDPVTIENIVSTGATYDEVAEALADAEDERWYDDHRNPTTARVADVRALIDDMLDHDEDARTPIRLEQGYASW